MKSAVEIYIEVAVYALFIVFGCEIMLSEEGNRAVFGAVMVTVSVARIGWLNYRWKQRGEGNGV